MRCVGQPHKRLAGLIVARTSKSRRKGSSNWKVSEVGVCPRIDGTHETDRANGTDRPEGPWEPSPASLAWVFGSHHGPIEGPKNLIRSQQSFTETRSVTVLKSSPIW